MKKILSIMLVAALAMPMFAEKLSPEERANADYSSWTPKAGDFAIGFSLDPFADFLGKMLNTASRSDYNEEIGGQGLLNKNFTNPIVSIMGEYMLTDQLGVRANVGFIVDYERTLTNIDDAAAKWENPYSRAQVQDVKKAGQYGASFSAGVDYRLGKRNVQGVFGAGLVYAFQTYSTKYSYGNAITQVLQHPDIADPMLYSSPESYLPNARLINDAADLTGADKIWHRFGLYTSVGVEWFVAPKICLGLNVNLDLLYKVSNNVCKQYEGWNIVTDKYEIYTDTRHVSNYSGVTFSTENIGANLYASFYF